MQAYQKESRYISIHETDYPLLLEKRIIARFHEVFSLTCGREYFSGDERQMYDEFEALAREMKFNPPGEDSKEKDDTTKIDEDDENHVLTPENGDGDGGEEHETTQSQTTTSRSRVIVRGRGGADIREFFPKFASIVSFHKSNAKDDVHICQYCKKDMKRPDALRRHLRRSIPCHESHPNFEKICKYCNKYEYTGKTKAQSNDHRHYCKRRNNGETYHERERKRLEKYESKEIKQLREEVQQVKYLYQQLMKS